MTSSPPSSPSSRPIRKSARRCASRRSTSSPRRPSIAPRSRSCGPTRSRTSTPSPRRSPPASSTSPTSSRRCSEPSSPPRSRRCRTRPTDGPLGPLATRPSDVGALTAGPTGLQEFRRSGTPWRSGFSSSTTTRGSPPCCRTISSAAGFVVDRSLTGRDGLAALERGDVRRHHSRRDAARHRRVRGLPHDPRRARNADPDADRARRRDRPHRRPGARRRRLPAQALQPARVAGAPARHPAPRAACRRPAARRRCASGGSTIDRDSRMVRVDGEEKALTSYQFDLLVALAENAGRVLSRERLMDLVKGEELDAFDRSIDVHISRIRARDRGRSEASAPHHHRARRRLRVRQDAGRRAMIVVRRRLFWKIYLTMLASLVAVAVLMGAFWSLVGENAPPRWRRVSPPCSTSGLIPERDSPPGAIAAAMKRLGDEMRRRRLASTTPTDRSPPRTARRSRSRPQRARRRFGPPPRIMRVDLADGRTVLARLRPPWPRPRLRILIDRADRRRRRRTRRLSGHRPADAAARGPALRRRALGRRARCRCASTASATTRSPWSRAPSTPPPDASRRLLSAQKALLANASHELRSPLARLRMAIELWLAKPSPDLHAEIKRNLAESDATGRRDPAGEPPRPRRPDARRPAPRRSHSASRRKRRRVSSRASPASRRAASRSRSTATRRCCAV